MFRIVVGLFALVLMSTLADAQKRVALVIGNSGYKHTPKLTNPRNDAADIASALRQFGFVVVEGVDLDKAAFDRKVRDFAEALTGADAGVLFYAGHGLQVGGRNYLVPVDAKGELEALLHLEMVRVDDIQRVMEASAKTNVMFLDACRDNPLARNLARSMGTRSSVVGTGLASIESGVGTLISFSTHPGAVASDGAGRNSPFTGALVKYITVTGDDLNTILINVRRDVRRDTQGKQVPWEHTSLEGRFYFGTPPAAVAVSPHRGTWLGTGPQSSVQFGGPPFCTYRVTLRDPQLNATIDDSGRVSAAALTLTMVEATVGACEYSVIKPNRHQYTGFGTIVGNRISLQLHAVPGNEPVGLATFEGEIKNSRLLGNLTVRRIDIRGSLAWTVGSQIK